MVLGMKSPKLRRADKSRWVLSSRTEPYLMLIEIRLIRAATNPGTILT